MKLPHLALSSAVVLAASCTLHAASICPGLGAATAGCDLVITVAKSGTTVVLGPSSGIASGTYDGSDDTLIGIVNNTGSALGSLHLSSSTNIFGFDGDGIDGYGAPGNRKDTSGYGGPNSYFTNINASATAGTVDFVTALAANGGTTYFSLEEALTPSQVVVTGPGPSAVPESSSLILLGTGLAGFAGAMRHRFISETRDHT